MTLPNFSSDLITFLGFFAAGLLVNLTPCVYPMLTVSASLFKPRKGTHETIRHSFAKAFSYFMGMTVMYSALGYAAASTGKLFGAALQNSWVLLVVGGLMFALACSMFGLFQLTIPVDLLNKVASWRKANYLGLFASGLLVGVFAAPCIGPPVILLLTTVADKGSPIFGLSAFFVFACGLGLPYLLLGTFSSLINQLPKAGNWLIWVEHSFGVVLFGFSAFYLSLAFHTSQLTPWVWPLTLILGGSYVGFIEKKGHEKKGFVRFKWTMSTIAIIVGGFFIIGQLTMKHEKIAWRPYSSQAVMAIAAKGELSMIDFYADWCINCHELEATVFSNNGVIQKLKTINTLRVDATKVDDEAVSSIIDKYDIVGLPTMVFLDKTGHEIKKLRVEGAPSAAQFKNTLDKFTGWK